LWRLKERLKADTRALLNGGAPEIFDKIHRLPPEKIAIVEPFDLSSIFLTISGGFPVATGSMKNPFTPMALVYRSLIWPLKPVQIMIGILGLI
jgi:hypothetical protein